MKCPKCGIINHENAKYCQECGEFLKDFIKPPEEEKIDDDFYFRSIKWLIIIPLAIIIFLLNIYGLETVIIVSIGVLFISGYLIKRPVEGAYNGLILGGISYFLSSLTIPNQYFTMTLAMQYTITGVVLGVIFGGFGGYVYKLIKNN